MTYKEQDLNELKIVIQAQMDSIDKRQQAGQSSKKIGNEIKQFEELLSRQLYRMKNDKKTETTNFTDAMSRAETVNKLDSTGISDYMMNLILQNSK